MEWATRSRKHEYEKELVKLMNDQMTTTRSWTKNDDDTYTLTEDTTGPFTTPTPTFRAALVQQLRTEKQRDPAAFLMFMILMAFIAISGPIALTLLVIEGYRQIGGVL